MLNSILGLAVLAGTSGSAALPPAQPADPPEDGVALIELMRQRYLGKWYRTLTFVQKTTLADGRVETWYEAVQLPGKLRIDIAPLEGKNTLLFRNDSLYEFKGGELAESRPMIHPLMVLGFDLLCPDTLARQFWIDEERLYFVRMVEPGKQNPSARVETQFNKYIPMGQVWLETEVRFLVDGDTRMLEEYAEPEIGVKLSPAIFESGRWVPSGWVR